jgi:hypothetical protein
MYFTAKNNEKIFIGTITPEMAYMFKEDLKTNPVSVLISKRYWSKKIALYFLQNFTKLKKANLRNSISFNLTEIFIV